MSAASCDMMNTSGPPAEACDQAFEGQVAIFKHIGTIGKFKSQAGILLDKEDCCALTVYFFKSFKHGEHKERRQPHGRFIQQHNLAAAHEGPAHGQHLLFTPGELCATVLPTFRQSFEVWLERHGHRGVYESDIASPRYREQPAPVLRGLAAGPGPVPGQIPVSDPRPASSNRLCAGLPLISSGPKYWIAPG